MRKQFESRLRERASENFTAFLELQENKKRISRQETIYKIVTIISLSLACISCACMSTLFPFLYYSMENLYNQVNSVLIFCEDTAQTASLETQTINENLNL